MIFLNNFQNSVILYQFNRAKQLQFSCKLNQLLNNSGVKGLDTLEESCNQSLLISKISNHNYTKKRKVRAMPSYKAYGVVNKQE